MTTPKPIKAKNAPTRPNFIPCQIKGLLIKPFVAPTICMVLMLNLLEYIVNLIAPLIKIMATKPKNPLKTKSQKLIL